MTSTELSKRGFKQDPLSGLFKIEELCSKPYDYVYTEKASDRVAPDSLPKVIYPSFWAMTADTITRNSTYYPKKELQGVQELNTGIYSWVNPYEVPVIENHNDHSSPVFGRIVCARMTKNGGQTYLNLIPRITNKDAIEKTLNGEYYTLSIGVSVEDAKCSICNRMQRAQGWCDHYKGESYEVKLASGKIESRLCYYEMFGLRGREISYVNVPSDKFAHIDNPDMGEDAVKRLLMNKSVAKATESVSKTFSFSPTNQKEIGQKSGKRFFSVDESFESESFSQIFAKEKGIEVMSKSTSETTELTGIEKEDPTPIQKSAVVLPELTSIDKIKEAAAEVITKEAAGEEVHPDIISAVTEAYSALGLSDDHLVRFQLSETTGVALFDKSTEASEILSKVFVNESEDQLTLSEADLVSVIVNTVKEKEALELKVSELEKTLEESADASNLTSAREQITSLESKLSAQEAATKDILVSVVANEMIKSHHKLATSKTPEELKAVLHTRTRESLMDSYADMCLDVVESTPVVNNPITEKTKESVSDQLKNLLSKKKISPSTKENEVKPNAETVEEGDGPVTISEVNEGKVTLKTDDKGNLIIETDGFEDNTLLKKIKKTTLDLSDLV